MVVLGTEPIVLQCMFGWSNFKLCDTNRKDVYYIYTVWVPLVGQFSQQWLAEYKKTSMLETMARYMETLKNECRLEFVTGLGGNYISEYNPVYCNIADCGIGHEMKDVCCIKRVTRTKQMPIIQRATFWKLYCQMFSIDILKPIYATQTVIYYYKSPAPFLFSLREINQYNVYGMDM